ncbi:MAG: PadR family transcriptional regulator [Firmicutes bacterium]|nr:PadR family transcriptional regulator [Bacillota bacterium]NPV30309.1 PadR family transcriptional regulator [Bacillota bacterium]
MCGIAGDGCNCSDQHLKRGSLTIPSLLLLLKKKPSHGYELAERLSTLSFLEGVPDPGVIYRHLRHLEENGMVESRLEPGSGGPARKIYSLTPEGDSYLRTWALTIQQKKKSLEGFLLEFNRCLAQEAEKENLSSE